MPSGVVDNQIIVGCTGGGGGTNGDSRPAGGGGGSGRTSGKFVLTPGDSIAVTVAGVMYKYAGAVSTFGSYLSCNGGLVGNNGGGGELGVSGGGNGGAWQTSSPGGASNCPAMFTLLPTAIDKTTGLYKAKSYPGNIDPSGQGGGGAGCYGTSGANSGGGANGSALYGSSGKVVIYYYVYE